MSICLDCMNSVPDGSGHGCPWSEHFKPVPGWDAVPTEIADWSGYQKIVTSSMNVLHCPLFEGTPQKKRIAPMIKDKTDESPCVTCIRRSNCKRGDCETWGRWFRLAWKHTVSNVKAAANLSNGVVSNQPARNPRAAITPHTDTAETRRKSTAAQNTNRSLARDNAEAKAKHMAYGQMMAERYAKENGI